MTEETNLKNDNRLLTERENDIIVIKKKYTKE